MTRSRARLWTLLGVGLLLALAYWALTRGPLQALAAYRDDVIFLSRQHMMLTVISGGLAVLVGVPLGVLLSRPRMRRFAETAMQGLNLGSTIPTLAVLALSMGLLGIGTLPAVFALWVASLLPIVRNTYTGLREVPAYLLEAGNGLGMRPLQILWRVELPNALYVMFAGIRTALAVNVGTVPLAFLIGGGGLGELIFTGIDLNEPAMMYAGAIPTALLAVLTDFIVASCAYWLIPRGVNPLRTS